MKPQQCSSGRPVVDRFSAWMAALEERHLRELTFAEVSRALRALSSAYVERRQRLAPGAALSGAGKRAAFAVFYAPLHYLLVRHIVQRLPTARDAPRLLIDLGCGTGAAGAAWATVCASPPRVLGIDRHRWALADALQTYRDFAIDGRTRRADVTRTSVPNGPAAVLAAFTMNELAAAARDALLTRLVERAARGDRVLIVEPLARAAVPWWHRWSDAFQAVGGRADEWRFAVDLPPLVAKLDRAAGLDHREITGRSLWLARSG